MNSWSVNTAVVLLSLMTACSASVGDVCDQEKARNIAYNRQGLPAYEGQALLVQSCANGQQCHSEAIGRNVIQRFGAPADLNFDALLVEQYLNAINSAPPVPAADAATGDSATADANISVDTGNPDAGMMSIVLTPEQEAQQRLRRIQNRIYEHRNALYATVLDGSMPPRNFTNDPKTYRRADDSTVPHISTVQGREILRNWLACGAPVVERTVAATPVRCDNRSACVVTRDCDTTMRVCRAVGDTVPRRVGGVLEPKFSSIFGNIFGTSTCGSTTCHGGSSAAILNFKSQSEAYNDLMRDVGFETCSGANARVIAGMPDKSLLISRIAGATCGNRMGNLEDDQIDVIRAWITAGAMND